MSVKPRISVIIPSYNESRMIGRCITSIKNQNFHLPYEIIVVDNNSLDNTVAIAKKLGVKVIKESQLGPGPTRNAGAKIAKGSILTFTDGDTTVPFNWLTTINEAFISNPTLVGLVGTFQFRRTTKLLKFLSQLAFPSIDLLNKLITGSFAFRGANFAIKKTVFETVGGFNPQYKALEDLELASRVNRIGEIGYLPKLKVQTTDRRFRNRLGRFLEDFIPIYISVAILKKPHLKGYSNIRK